MEIYSTSIDGTKFDFHVVKNLTRPCICGIPACGREAALWYEKETKSIALIFDGGFLESMISKFLEQNKVDYKLLPEFIQEWNESKGWEDAWFDQICLLNIEDFLKSLDLIEYLQTEEAWFQKDMEEYLNETREIAFHAQKLKSDLKMAQV